MSRRRFFVPRDCICGNCAVLPADQAHHLRNVLRIEAGDPVELFDGEGAGYTGVVALSGGELRITSLEPLPLPSEPDSRLVLAQALLKSDKFEWVLQKATELGIHEIVPMATRHCDIRLREGRLEARLERWRRIVREAARQCGSVKVPKILAPVDFPEVLRRYGPGDNSKFLFYEQAPARWDIAIRVSPGALLCIGPEGGWHPGEIEAAIRADFRAFNLGARILRAETAAVAAIALVQFQIAV